MPGAVTVISRSATEIRGAFEKNVWQTGSLIAGRYTLFLGFWEPRGGRLP